MILSWSLTLKEEQVFETKRDVEELRDLYCTGDYSQNGRMKPCVLKSLQRSRSRWQDNIRMDLAEIGVEKMNYLIHLTKDSEELS